MKPIWNSRLVQYNLTSFGTKMFEAEPYNHVCANVFQLIFRKVADVRREKELAERRKNDPQLDQQQDHLVRKIFSKFRRDRSQSQQQPPAQQTQSPAGWTLIAAAFTQHVLKLKLLNRVTNWFNKTFVHKLKYPRPNETRKI